jgi:peptidoglycan/LPS O-acetylase OafA/YrhL
MTRSNQTTRGNEMLRGLHGLRFIAAITIVIFHLTYFVDLIPHSEWLKPLSNAVPLFFCLSAFVLMYQVTPLVGQPYWVHDYFVRRFYRIAPLYYVMMPIDVILLYQTYGFPLPSAGTILYNLLFIFGFSPSKMPGLVLAGWSVGVEMIFYTLLPLIVLKIRRLDVAILFLIASMGLGYYASSTAFYNGPLPWVLKWNFLSNLRWFACGVVGYFVYVHLTTFKIQRSLVIWICATICAFAIAGYGLLDIQSRPIFIATLLIAVCVWQSYSPSRTLLNPVPQFCADRSYSIYLWHSPIMILLAPIYASLFARISVDLSVAIGVAVSLGLILLCADVSYRMIEKPGMRLGRRFARGKRLPIVTIAPDLVAVKSGSE